MSPAFGQSVNLDELRIKSALASEASIEVPNIRHSARHTCAEVPAGFTEDYNHPAGHVLAAVFSNSFDHSCGSRIANGKAFASAARCKQKAGSRTVEGHVPQNGLRLRRAR